MNQTYLKFFKQNCLAIFSIPIAYHVLLIWPNLKISQGVHDFIVLFPPSVILYHTGGSIHDIPDLFFSCWLLSELKQR